MIYQTLNNYTLFSNSASMLLKFFMIWSSNVVRCCLLHMSIIIYRSILYLLYSYLCPCLNLNLLMSCLCDLFFIFIIINIISLKHTHFFLEHRTYSSERPGRSFNFGSTFCLKLVRIMLETSHLARRYKTICTFRKYTFWCLGPLNFADVSIFFAKN